MTQNPPRAPFRLLRGACLILAVNAAIPAVLAQSKNVQTAAATAPAYADLADYVTVAPLVAKAQVRDVISLPAASAAGTPVGHRRVFVEARVTTLIRGDNGIAPTVSYLIDLPLDAKGKIPKLKKKDVLIFARPGTKPGQLQLVGKSAQIAWSPSAEATVRSIVSELLGGGAAPKIVDIGDAFHVAGTIAGEGETQIFLKTDTGDPVSLSVIRRPNQPPRWAVALGEVVDEAAEPPKPNTLLWYRLACGLPAQLPPRSVRSLALTDAEAARADYAVVLQGLGPCKRSRPPEN